MVSIGCKLYHFYHPCHLISTQLVQELISHATPDFVTNALAMLRVIVTRPVLEFRWKSVTEDIIVGKVTYVCETLRLERGVQDSAKFHNDIPKR